MPKKIVKKGKNVAKKMSCGSKCECKCVTGPISVKSAFGKSQVATTIAERTCISKKQAGATIEALNDIIAAHLSKKGPGEFTFPGVAKFRVVRKPATKARQGVNPFTGEPMTFAAKPARNVVKIRALKKLKDIAK